MDDLTNDLINAIVPYGEAIDLEIVRAKFQVILAGYNISKQSHEIALTDDNHTMYLIQSFLSEKLAKGCSMRTIAYYKLTICNFFAQVRKIPEQVTDVDVKVYMSKRMLGGVSKTTVNNEYRNLSSFYAWAQKEEIILKNPMNKVDKVKERKVQRKAFTEMEIELIRAACKTKRERRVRDERK